MLGVKEGQAKDSTILSGVADNVEQKGKDGLICLEGREQETEESEKPAQAEFNLVAGLFFPRIQ